MLNTPCFAVADSQRVAWAPASLPPRLSFANATRAIALLVAGVSRRRACDNTSRVVKTSVAAAAADGVRLRPRVRTVGQEGIKAEGGDGWDGGVGGRSRVKDSITKKMSVWPEHNEA